MKIKDIFKGAATAAIAFGASRLLPEPIAKPVGTALSKALFSPSGGGSGPSSASDAFVQRRINLSQFGMGTCEHYKPDAVHQRGKTVQGRRISM